MITNMMITTLRDTPGGSPHGKWARATFSWPWTAAGPGLHIGLERIPSAGQVRYSTEVPQRTRTEVAVPGRRRTVTCGGGRGWTCCRQMACKRSGVRISLAPPGQKHNSNKSNSEYSSKIQQRRPDGPPYVCSGRYLPLARAADKTADSRHRSVAFQACHLGKLLCSGALTLALGHHQARASGQPGGDCCRICKWSLRCSPRVSHDLLPRPAPAMQRCGWWIASGARVVAPDGAGEPVRCAAQALRSRRGAVWRSHPARALRRPPDKGLPWWAGLITLRPPRRPPQDHQLMESARASLARARYAPAPPSTRPRRAGVLLR